MAFSDSRVFSESAHCPHCDGHELALPTPELKQELHRLVDLLDGPYIPGFIELARACLPDPTTQRLLWMSLCYVCLA